MVTRELLIFIQNEQTRGVAADQIELTLLKEGWDLQEVKDALTMAPHFKAPLLSKEPTPPASPDADSGRVSRKSTSPFLIFAIFVFLGVIGIGVYRFVAPVHTTVDSWIFEMRSALLI